MTAAKSATMISAPNGRGYDDVAKTFARSDSGRGLLATFATTSKGKPMRFIYFGAEGVAT